MPTAMARLFFLQRIPDRKVGRDLNYLRREENVTRGEV
jgi:hypothetical protein